MSPSGRAAALLALLPLLAACQAIGGFQEFEGSGSGGGAATAATTTATATSATSSGDTTSTSTSSGEGGATAASTGSGGASCDPGAPPDTEGGAMVAARLAGGTCFWIDATEVTAAAYAVFQGSNTDGQLDVICDANDSFVPDCDNGDPPGVEDDQPIVCVDWCDALAYCNAVGKRLCRGDSRDGIGGVDDPEVSEWFAACSLEGANTYPYPGVFDPDTCNGSQNEAYGCDPTPCNIAPVGALPGCETQSGIVDLSGNVAEWSDECSTQSAEGTCTVRGGSASGTGSTPLRCDSFQQTARTARNPLVGFRCCADVVP